VCRKCERWNLTPVEERWEAIEECERAYRGTKLRVSTDQIGLARLSEGLELVRIGQPLRPEFAAWRYGDQFGRRRRRNLIKGTAIAVGIVAVPTLGPLIGITFAGAGLNVFQIVNGTVGMFKENRVVARFPAPDGSLLLVRGRQVRETLMVPPIGRESWGLRISHRTVRDPQVPWWQYDPESETSVLRGEDAIRAASQLLPHLNRNGASSRVVADAIKLATENDGPTATFDAAARRAAKQRDWNNFGAMGKLSKVPAEIRLALEMVSHEDSERRALEGELYLLEDAWKEAEEIAGISDDLFLPEEISTQLNEMKRDVK
jgi:hypothetical protein